MKAIIRSVYSTGVDVEAYVSEDSLDDGRWIRLLIGPDDGRGEESFDVLVCTPRWLMREIQRDGMQLVRHALVMEPFELPQAMARLTQKVSIVTGDSWLDLARDLSQIGHWEFQGCHE